MVSPPPLLVFDEEPQEPEPVDAEQASLFDVVEGDEDAGVYSLPDAGVLRRSKGVSGDSAQRTAHIAETLVAALGNFGVDATVVGEIAGPRVTRYELQLAPGTKVSKVAALKDDLSYALATTEIRILAPIPGKQAVGVEVPNHSPNLVTLGDIYDDLPATASPLSVWLGKDISGQRRLDRPRAHAAPADRRHDRLGQVRLHQHDPHARSCCARRPTTCG